MTGQRTKQTLGSKRAILVGIVSLLLLAPGSAWAETRLDRLEVSLWPEYDQPAMLVMLRGFLPIDTTFPATVKLPMPVEAGVNAVAYRGGDGTMIRARHGFKDEGDWVYVTLTTESREIRFEYYASLDTSRLERSYLFRWPGGTEIAEVVYDVLEPRGSSGLEVVPAGTESRLANGLTEARGNLGPKLRSDEFTVEVSYAKATTSLTADPPGTAQATRPEPVTMPVAQTPPDDRPQSWLPLLVVATLAFGAGFWLGRSRKRG